MWTRVAVREDGSGRCGDVLCGPARWHGCGYAGKRRRKGGSSDSRVNEGTVD